MGSALRVAANVWLSGSVKSTLHEAFRVYPVKAVYLRRASYSAASEMLATTCSDRYHP